MIPFKNIYLTFGERQRGLSPSLGVSRYSQPGDFGHNTARSLFYKLILHLKNGKAQTKNILQIKRQYVSDT